MGEERFSSAGGYRDIWAAVLWILTTLLVIGYGSYRLHEYLHHPETFEMTPPDHTLHPEADDTHAWQWPSTTRALGVGSTATLVSVSISIPLLWLIRSHAEGLILYGNVFYISLLGVAALLSFFTGQMVSGIVTGILCLIAGVWLYYVRHRIPFAACCLTASANVVNQYKATVANAAVFSLLFFAYVVIWGTGVWRYSSSGVEERVLWPWLLQLFWTSQVLSAITHVTTCGVVAMWYYAGENEMPRNPTLGALRRATTYSLGSLCFGSLIVAILKTIRALAREGMRNENHFVRGIVMCLLNCIESLVEYFNEYAYVYVADYGTSYVPSAKAVWQLIKTNGILAVINDSLLGAAYILMVLGGSVLSGLSGLLWGLSPVHFLLGLLIGVVTLSMILGVVQSGVMTIFVCFAEDPEKLCRSNASLYDTLREKTSGVAVPTAVV